MKRNFCSSLAKQDSLAAEIEERESEDERFHEDIKEDDGEDEENAPLIEMPGGKKKGGKSKRRRQKRKK